METSFKKEYKKSVKGFSKMAELAKKYKSMRWSALTVHKDGEPVYPRFGKHEGMLLNHTFINKDISAILYLDRNFDVKHEVIPTKILKEFLKSKKRSNFFSIEYEIFGDINHDAYWHTDWYKKGDSPFWYSIEEFRDTVKVYVKDPKERKELLEIADAREKQIKELGLY